MSEINTQSSGPANKLSLDDLSHILVFIGIFLFFAGWIYLYYFYDYFGLSLSLLNPSYAEYVVHSYAVLTSYWCLPLITCLALVFVYRIWLKQYISISIFLAVMLFPSLYWLAKKVANDTAVNIRTGRNSLRKVSIVFNSDAGALAKGANIDSTSNGDAIFVQDVALLKDDTDTSQLYLLAQNEDYFFVLVQAAVPAEGPKALPLGRVYFIKKSSVLYSKITIRSNEK
jgi:hypothetical protein